MQLTRHVALTRIKDLHRSVPKRFRHFLASAESCAETARVASSIGRQVLRRYSFDSDWVCLYGTLEEKNSESLCSTLPAILAIPLAVMPAISVCWPAIPSAWEVNHDRLRTPSQSPTIEAGLAGWPEQPYEKDPR